MLKDITIGQYVSRESAIHRLDPRVKLRFVILYIILLLIDRNLPLYIMLSALFVAAVAIAGIPVSYMMKGTRGMLVFIGICSAISIFTTPDNESIKVGIFTMTQAGIIKACFIFWRMLLMIFMSSLLMYTTTPSEITDGLEKAFHMKSDIAMGITIALRFISVLSEEMDRIIKAQTMRGAAFDTGNFFQRAKSMLHVIRPQNNGITIEEVLNRELSRLLDEEIVVIGASRTDSGVHAIGNVAVFDTQTRIPAEKISFALNQRLPEDIRITDSCKVEDDFHPRFCDTIKTYQYNIWNARFPNPMVRLYSKFCYYRLDVEKMQKAADYLVGEHDFKSFCSARTQVENTVRTVTEISFSKQGDMVTMTIKGTGFLYNMVRIIMGTLLKVGMGMYPPEQVKDILEACDRAKAGPKAEACGLTLVGIEYL